MENGLMIIFMGEEYFNLEMEINMKVNGLIKF